ncbi:hypothetical protein Tco_0235324, partial [Tanacetum coccineum]
YYLFCVRIAITPVIEIIHLLIDLITSASGDLLPLEHSFLLSEGLQSIFPQISSICLDRHLSDHRPILLREIFMDFKATPFRLFHSWFSWDGFDKLVSDSWNGMQLEDRNDMVRFKKKLQGLKKVIRKWVTDRKKNHNTFIKDTKLKLGDIDKKLDCGEVTDELILLRMNLMQSL